MSVDNSVIGEIFTQMMLEVARAVDRLGVDRATHRSCDDQTKLNKSNHQSEYQCSNEDHCLACIAADDIPLELISFQIDKQKVDDDHMKDDNFDACRILVMPSHRQLSFYHAAVTLFKLVADVYPCIHCRNHYRLEALPMIDQLMCGPDHPEPETMTKFVHTFKSAINNKRGWKNLNFLTLVARNLVFTYWCDATKLWDILIMIALAMPDSCNDHVDPEIMSFYDNDASQYMRETSAHRWRAFYQFVEILALLAKSKMIRPWFRMDEYLWPLPDQPSLVAKHLIIAQYQYAKDVDSYLHDALMDRVADNQWFEDFVQRSFESNKSLLSRWMLGRAYMVSPLPEDITTMDYERLPTFEGDDLDHYVDSIKRIYEIPHRHQLSEDFVAYM